MATPPKTEANVPMLEEKFVFAFKIGNMFNM